MKIAKPEAVKRGARAPRLEDIYVSADVRRATGKALREAVPRTAHAGWKAQKGRSDPVELLSRSNADRVEALIPIRFGRMSAIIEDWDSAALRQYARMCAHALARSHARTGDAAMISGYMGSGQTFDDAIGEFAVEYADQNRADHRAFVGAIREGTIEAIVEG